jgi:hypothetical protein
VEMMKQIYFHFFGCDFMVNNFSQRKQLNQDSFKIEFLEDNMMFYTNSS